MIAKVAAEVLKLRTTRTFWALAGSTFALILLIVVLSLSLDDELDSDEDSVHSLLSTAGLSGLLMLVLGAVVGAGEYRHGTIASTLLVTPNRLRAVTAQTLAVALGGAAWGSRRQRSPRRSRCRGSEHRRAAAGHGRGARHLVRQRPLLGPRGGAGRGARRAHAEPGRRRSSSCCCSSSPSIRPSPRWPRTTPASR